MTKAVTEPEYETDPRIDAETGEVLVGRPQDEDAEDTVSAASTVDYERIKRWVMQRDGKDYIQFAGLLDLLHQESKGYFTIYTHLVQAPNEANGMLAIVEARVEVLVAHDPGGPFREVQRSATGLGDASPQSVNRMIAPHIVRMAETRAKGRALRDLLNIPLVTLEELGPMGPAQDNRAAPRPAQSGYQQEQARTAPPAPAANPNTDGLTVEGQWYTRDQIWGFFQQRRTQMRERNLSFPSPALQRTSPLPQIAEQTRQMRMAIAADIAKAKPA